MIWLLRTPQRHHKCKYRKHKVVVKVFAGNSFVELLHASLKEVPIPLTFSSGNNAMLQLTIWPEGDEKRPNQLIITSVYTVDLVNNSLLGSVYFWLCRVLQWILVSILVANSNWEDEVGISFDYFRWYFWDMFENFVPGWSTLR